MWDWRLVCLCVLMSSVFKSMKCFLSSRTANPLNLLWRHNLSPFLTATARILLSETLDFLLPFHVFSRSGSGLPLPSYSSPVAVAPIMISLCMRGDVAVLSAAVHLLYPQHSSSVILARFPATFSIPIPSSIYERASAPAMLIGRISGVWGTLSPAFSEIQLKNIRSLTCFALGRILR